MSAKGRKRTFPRAGRNVSINGLRRLHTAQWRIRPALCESRGVRESGPAGLSFLFAFLPRLSIMDEWNATPPANGIFFECLRIALYAAQRRLVAEKATHQFHRARNYFTRGSAPALRHFWVVKPINISTKCSLADARNQLTGVGGKLTLATFGTYGVNRRPTQRISYEADNTPSALAKRPQRRRTDRT